MDRWQYTSAFVVQFRPSTDVAAGRFQGIVEHVATGDATRFGSLEELLDFVARVLSDVDDPGREACSNTTSP